MTASAGVRPRPRGRSAGLAAIYEQISSMENVAITSGQRGITSSSRHLSQDSSNPPSTCAEHVNQGSLNLIAANRPQIHHYNIRSKQFARAMAMFMPSAHGSSAHTDARGEGIGEQLTEAAIAEARRRGARTIDLTSRPSREAANALYQKMGFELRETNVYRLVVDD